MNPNQLHKLSELVLALKSQVKCPVCLDYVEATAELQCSHRLCTVCLPEIKTKRQECPVCKMQILKRSPIYKDLFADELGKFTNRTCQLIKEKYAREVEELIAKKANLQEIIETAPQDAPKSPTINPQIPEAKTEDDVFDKLIPDKPKRCYVNKKKNADRLAKHKLFNVDSDSTRVKIMKWLNDNQHHALNILTQSPQFIDNDDDNNSDFQMPSISQVKSKRKPKLTIQRSQSWTEDDHLPQPLLKRYQSLTEHLNEADDYNIEDDHSETLVKQVERKVLQDMLEDECLAKLDLAAQMTEPKPKRTPSKRKPKTVAPENMINSKASSGWERIKNIKKTLSRASKEPKKLNISVQDQNGNYKKSPKRLSGGSKGRTKMSPKGRETIQNKDNKHENLKTAKNNTFNLSAVENYFEKHMSKIKVVPSKDTSSDMEIDVTNVKKVATRDDNDKNDEEEEDIFLLPTQETSSRSSNRPQCDFCHISPVPTDLTDMNTVAVCLSDNLKLCLSSAANVSGPLSPQLVRCFTNLLTYVDKIVTKATSNDIGVQTLATLSHKYVQTTQNTCDVQVQSEVPAFVDREIQTLQSEENSHHTKVTKKARPSTVNDLKGDKTQKSVLICNLEKTSKEVNEKLTHGESQNRKFKRIRKPATDSDSDEGEYLSKKRFVRNDLTVEFVDSVKETHENKGSTTPESERMDYDKYLLEVMSKYDSSPPSKKLATSNSNSQKTVSKAQKDVVSNSSGDHVFTGFIEFQENLDKFDQEILEYERATKAFSTELDLVENTPIASPKTKMPRLPKKKKDCMAQPLQIISKGSASCGSTSKNPAIATENDEVAINPTILNRNLKSDQCTDDVADILKDLEKDEEFFSSNFGGSKADPSQKAASNKKDGEHSNVDEENIDKVLANLNDFDDDDDGIDEELEKISFIAAQEEANRNEERVQILQNIKLRSQSGRNKEPDPDAVIDSTDVSDEEIVETTPQERRMNSNDRSFFENIELMENAEDSDSLAVYLPPPPGFGDECATESQVENQNQKGNDKSSVTPDRLTDFIVTPDERTHYHTQKQESQCSLTFKPTFATPNIRPGQDSKVPRLADRDFENVFSPITKTSIKLTQNNFTPLVPLAKSSSKKSNLMTSTPNQKSILNYVVSSQNSPAAAALAKPCIMWSRILNRDLSVFAQLECKKLVTTSRVFGPQVTHLVVLVDARGQIVSHTVKILQAIAAGIWVVRYEWAEDCLKMNRIVSEEPYEVLDFSGAPGPRTARLSRLTNPLFRGFKFYCAPPLKSICKGDLEIILRLSGAEIANDLEAMLQNDGKVRIILTESSATEETDHYEGWFGKYKVVTVDVEWLTNCIGQYKLVSFRPFMISGDESTICDLGYPSTLIESVPCTLTEGV